MRALQHSVDPARDHLEDDRLLSDPRLLHANLALYQGQINVTLQRIHGVQPPPAARASYRAYVRSLQALGRSAARLYGPATRRRATHRQLAAVRRSAVATQRAHERLRDAL